MTKRYEKPLTPEELAALPDEAVDTTEIPPLGEAFRTTARLTQPRPVGTDPTPRPPSRGLDG